MKTTPALAAQRKLSRIWRPHLDSDEFAIIHYVLDAPCTIFDGGEATMRATFQEMGKGIPADEGAAWPWKLPPIGVKRAHFYAKLRSLREKGVLQTCTQLKKTCFTVDLTWMPEKQREAV